ncbi:MAG: hypothetical protein KDD06_21560 [Phaeodactylibacter sp.]|nr:hypothetical protein [Phaeodactylibacter sp.]MCB9264791.1 hypothetical protein [Lewinellaceae bacterium]MCB9287709.1 hypothetical protein [Lewinellaceae bacterium]
MKNSILVIIFSLSILHTACGPEVIILFIPAITAFWCVEDDPCHKFRLRTDNKTKDNGFQGPVGGLEFYINPADGKAYQDPGFQKEGENFIAGAFENLNIAFTVTSPEGGPKEREYVGAMEVENDTVSRMTLQSLTDGRKFVLTRPPSSGCECE